jgi:molybdopterin-guanine dinucleotide biosynthesis protein A
VGTDALKREDILGVVLAGGQSRRFGQDKALARLGDRDLIGHVIAQAQAQAAALAISGRDYGLGLPVIPDAVPSEGPLTGVLSALLWARAAGFRAVATFSCDAPFFPPDLVMRLASGMPPESACGFAEAGGTRHPVFALWKASSLGRLQEIYPRGIRALQTAQDEIGATAVVFSTGPGPDGDMFFNINRKEDQAAAQAWLDTR